MRIQSINYFANRNINNKQATKVNSNYKMSMLKVDTVSFTGKPAETSVVVKAKIRAEQLEKDASDIKTTAESYALESYETLDEVKRFYVDALSYIKALKKSTIPTCDDGRKIDGISVMDKKGKTHPIIINVYDDTETPIQEIKVKDGLPSQITEYNSDGTVRISQFTGNSIVISEGAIPSEGTIETGYVFDKGNLVSVRKNRNLNVRPFFDEKTYYYNEKGDLWLSESNTRTYVSGKREIDDRYNFQDGKLANYYSGFVMMPNRLMSWDESFHYDKYKFIGVTENAQQIEKNKPVIANSAIYIDATRCFVEAASVECSVNDFAQTTLKEK